MPCLPGATTPGVRGRFHRAPGASTGSCDVLDGMGPGGVTRSRLWPVEIFYTGLLVAVALLITWFAFYVVYRLVHEEK